MLSGADASTPMIGKKAAMKELWNSLRWKVPALPTKMVPHRPLGRRCGTAGSCARGNRARRDGKRRRLVRAHIDITEQKEATRSAARERGRLSAAC